MSLGVYKEGLSSGNVLKKVRGRRETARAVANSEVFDLGSFSVIKGSELRSVLVPHIRMQSRDNANDRTEEPAPGETFELPKVSNNQISDFGQKLRRAIEGKSEPD